MEYGIYSKEDIIPYEEIKIEAEALKEIASGWRENIQYINNGLREFTDDIINVEGKTPVETFTELVTKMTKHASDIDEFADAILSKAAVIKSEEEAELERHQKEAEAKASAENTCPINNDTKLYCTDDERDLYN